VKGNPKTRKRIEEGVRELVLRAYEDEYEVGWASESSVVEISEKKAREEPEGAVDDDVASFCLHGRARRRRTNAGDPIISPTTLIMTAQIPNLIRPRPRYQYREHIPYLLGR